VCSRAAGTGAYTVHAVSSSSSTQIASIDSALSFDPAKSFYLTNSFGWGSPALLVCGDTPSLGDPAFWYFYKDKPDGIKLSIIAPETLAGEFSNIRAHRESYRIVALSNGKIVLVDMRAYPHAWYSGKIDTAHGDITFSALDGSPAFEQDSTFDAFTCKPTTNGFIYAKAGGSGVIFHTVTISGTTVSDTLCTVPNVTFTGAYDAQNRPLVTSDGKLKAVVITGTSYSLAACEAETVAFTRADLIEEIYPYTWIQGDYNGDGKTDIGIVHLKDSKWYFAETKGTVPDLISNVKNGIGGTYDFTYENSTRFDNTDENGIARLPMNYKVCTSVSVHDGYGGKIVTNYAYAGGFAYSAFIDGKKETDYFGFSEFTVTDAAGHSTVNAYNTVPYDDYRKNRALAGAIKTSTAYGTDRKEYSRTEYDYTLHEVRENNTQSPSWLIEPTKVRRFMQGTLVETREAHIELAAAGYSLESRTDSVTDHYGSGQTVTSFSEFTNDESTNEMRIAVKKNFVGSANEVRSDYTYDSRGNLSIELNRYTGSGLAAVKDRETRFAYDAFGNRTRVTRMGEGPGRIVETEYDRILNQYVVKETLVNDPELSTSYEINYDAAFGAAQKKTDPNGGSIYYDYDSCGRLSRQRIDTDSGVETLARYYYDAPATGWSARPASGKVIQYTGDGFTKETRVYVDGLGRTLHSVWNSSDSRCVKSGKVTYDASGRVIRKGQSLWADASEIDSYAETTEKNTTNTEYDASGRVSRVTLPAAYSGEAQVYTSMIYNDPWETVSVQSWGRNTRTVKNARGMVLTVEEAGRGDDGKMARSQIGFCYDLAGNRIKKQDLDDGERMTSSIDTSLFAPGKKDASGKNIAQWRYDGFGQLVETSDPDLGYSKAVYNSYGDVAQRIDSQNRTTTYTYDRQGRLTAKMLPETEGRVIYSYDTGGENALGKVTKIDDPAQTKQFDYDRIGRVRHENREIKNNGGSYDTDFTYNLLNRTKSIKYPIDPTTKERITTVYTHGASGIEGIEITQGLQTKTIVKDVTYNEFGQMTGLTRGNETRTSYTYDERGRLTNLLTRSAGTGTVIQNVTYGFKPDNSISAREDAIGADIETRRVRYDYRYDGLNRLVGAEGNLQHGTDETTAKKFKLAYGYAQNGNMLSKSVYDTTTDSVDDRWTYTYANHAVTSISSSKTGTRFLMNYDVSGNMTSQEDRLKKVLKDIDFDSSNRITKVTNPANGKIIGTYEYDDQGFRVRKLAAEMLRGAEKTVEVLYPSMYFAIEKQRNSIGVEIPNTSYAVNNIYLNGVRVAASLPNGECQYYLTDQVDSVSVVTDDKASVVNRFEYLPFGEAWASEGDGLNRPKYCSAELDAETNFYYMNARYQDPGICRFTTPDTVIDGEYSTQGWNRYSYCHNNPIIYKDPTGHLTAGEIDSMGWMGGDGGKLNDRGSPIKGVNLETLLQPAEKGGRLTSPMKRMRAVTDGRTGETVMASHPANDFSAKNTPLQSIIKGKMEYAENRGGAGNIIRVKGDNGVTVEYFHTTDDPKKKNDSKQLDGKRVKPGDPLGFSGNTGFGTGSGYHLHVQVWEHVENTLGNNIRARLQMSESGKGMYRMEEGDATPRFYHDPQKYLKDNKQRIKKEGS
jgi:RHS repeat-associated protein